VPTCGTRLGRKRGSIFRPRALVRGASRGRFKCVLGVPLAVEPGSILASFGSAFLRKKYSKKWEVQERLASLWLELTMAGLTVGVGMLLKDTGDGSARRGGMAKRLVVLGLAVLFCAILLHAPTASGQAVFGSIIGTVTDPQGNAVVGGQNNCHLDHQELYL